MTPLLLFTISKPLVQKLSLCRFCQFHKLELIMLEKGQTEKRNDANIFQDIYVCLEYDTLQEMGFSYNEVCPHNSLELQTLDIRRMMIDYLH